MKIIIRQSMAIFGEKRYLVNIIPDSDSKNPNTRFYGDRKVSLASVERLRKIKGKNLQKDIWL